MSDFRLHQIAPFLEKDEKTLRRWCRDGSVPSISSGEPVGCYQTQGGHWRIIGQTREEVVEFLRARMPKTSRRRQENAYPLAGDRSKTPREAWQTALPGAWRFAETSPRVHVTPWGSISKRAPLSEKHRFLEAVVRGVLEKNQNLQEWLHQDEAIREKFQSIAGVLGWENASEILPEVLNPTLLEPLTAQKLAYECGVRIRTFYRWFPRWRESVQKLVVAKYRKKLFDEEGGTVAGEDGLDFEDMDTRNGWKESFATGKP
jgi:hypothetical protein